VMVGNKVYASNATGKTYVFEATPERFRLIAENQLGDEVYASPAICGGHIYLRVPKRGERMRGFLYSIGNAQKEARDLGRGATGGIQPVVHDGYRPGSP